MTQNNFRECLGKTMNEIKLSYRRKNNGGVIIMDYSDSDNIRYCGKSFNWSTDTNNIDEFNTMTEAENAAHKYFTGE